MASTNLSTIREGDWISGTSHLDEMFIGFVQSLNVIGTVKVYVTQSDHQEIVGSVIETKLSQTKKLANDTASSPEQLRSMIELALITHDHGWFEELVARQTTPSTGANDWSGKPTGNHAGHPRLFRTVPRDLTGRS